MCADLMSDGRICSDMSTREALNDTVALLQGKMRWFWLGQVFSNLGSGLTLSLFVVYLHEVRGISIATATLVLSWMAVVGFVVSPIVGTLVDRFGPRRVLMCATAIMGSAVYLYGFITSPALALMFGTLGSIGTSGLWAPASALIVQEVPEERRQAAFGLNFMLLNLGLGLGGLVGSLIVDVDTPSTFQTLYTVNAMSYFVFLFLIFLLKGIGGPVGHISEAHQQEGWAQVLQDRNLLRLVGIGMFFMLFGYASIEAGFAIFVTSTAQLDERWIGVAFFANTFMIVVAQLTILGWLKGRSRTKVMGLIGLMWALSWWALPFAPTQSETVAVILIVIFMAAFGAGETLWSPTMPGLVNSLAPAHLRGRYNAASGLTWNVSSMLGPMIAGGLIGSGRGVLWAVMCGSGILFGGLWAQRLRRHLTAEQDGRLAEPALH